MMALNVRSMRSILITNISPGMTEEQMKNIFSEIGSVVNFRLFCDSDTGKSKGCAFCEFKDQEVALNAVHILNGQELKGRVLRVEIAASDKVREDLESLGLLESVGELQAEDAEESPEKAPEEISKAVASLPAEQMFELMKQMKMCIENNPHEARNLLLQNPQLAYALLQAQVIMRIVDPEVALKILNRPAPAPVTSTPAPSDTRTTVESLPQAVPQASEILPAPRTAVLASGRTPVTDPRVAGNSSRPSLLGERPPVMPVPLTIPAPPAAVIPNAFPEQDILAMGDRDLRQLPTMDRDMRFFPAIGGDKDMRQPLGDIDFRTQTVPANVPENRPFDPRFRAMQGSNATATGFDRSRMAPATNPRTANDPRITASQTRVEDPRKASLSAAPSSSANPRFASAGNAPSATTNATTVPPPPPPRQPGATAMADLQDEEKAALIMQVLQLSDQQISMLPPEQRQSVIILKEQIARSQIV